MSPSRPYSFGLVSIVNPNISFAQNKDLNGGLGTTDDYQGNIITHFLNRVKQKGVRLPVVGFAYLQAVLKQKGHRVLFFDGRLPEPGRHEFDVLLLYGSMVDHAHENEVCRRFKESFPRAKVGFFGPFPSIEPELFANGDFILAGEAESFFMNDFRDPGQLHGRVPVTSPTDYEALPPPDLDGFDIKKYGYFPALCRKPFFTLQSSKGCPFSCSYYCAYGANQGPEIRQRSPEKTVEDIQHLASKYGVKGILFRDPVFGLKPGFIERFCRLIIDKKIKTVWGIETRLDHLTTGLIDLMYEAGLRLINIGVETSDPEVAKNNRRKLVEEKHQERIVRHCFRRGVKVSAFYIIGLESDTPETVKKTVDYAVSLNTYLARFSVITPCPGTGFYDRLKKDGRLSEKDFQRYSQFNLVFKHGNLDPQQMDCLLKYAYRRYYFRPSYWSVFFRYAIHTLFRGG